MRIQSAILEDGIEAQRLGLRAELIFGNASVGVFDRKNRFASRHESTELFAPTLDKAVLS